VLVHLRGATVRHLQEEEGLRGRLDGEAAAMRLIAAIFSDRKRYERAQRLARIVQMPLARRGAITRLPGPLAGWTALRDAPAVPKQTFREWWTGRAHPRR
jgi:L-lactate dehydrogenase complex protein LldF